MKKSDFEYLLKLLKEYVGWDFDEDKYFIIDSKLDVFLREKGYTHSEDLVIDLKDGNKTLLWEVVEALAMSDTSFFRDYKVFQYFEKNILPQIKQQNPKNLRIWSLGCSTGQEAYSIAMSVKNVFQDLSDISLDIIGTDISTAAITKAQKGSYSQFEVQMGLPARELVNYFQYDRGSWQIKSEIMNIVEFRRYNMLENLTFSKKFDIIFCRNVLRFFDVVSQQKIIAYLRELQEPNGYLYIGLGEQLDTLEGYYEPVQGSKCLYKAKDIVVEAKNPKETNPKTNIPSFVRPKYI